ncbi:hypothetical protein EXN66_Car010376 [Channa argus]|uniref:Uncharacterized protein n=1 Tax=Channa argus TaxID=215402 RepID=A0A6G1PWK1_CHAAH|nr:hypothetical protein EXN66_Car010376 [Channa argus]
MNMEAVITLFCYCAKIASLSHGVAWFLCWKNSVGINLKLQCFHVHCNEETCQSLVFLNKYGME